MRGLDNKLRFCDIQPGEFFAWELDVYVKTHPMEITGSGTVNAISLLTGRMLMVDDVSEFKFVTTTIRVPIPGTTEVQVINDPW